MNLINFIIADANIIFASAIAVVMIIAIIEVMSVMIGAGLSDVLDAIIPDLDSNISGTMAYINVGRVPLLILIIIFLTVFGIIGLGLQLLIVAITDIMISSMYLSIPALIMTIPITRSCSIMLRCIIPKDETEAVSSDSFIGSIAVITIGTASKGHPAEAKLLDKFGQTHYIMVEPDDVNCQFSYYQGDELLIVSMIKDGLFAVIQKPDYLPL